MNTLRSFSFGGGVQSTAALVLAAEGRIDFPLFLFSNVGADSENPATLKYVEEYAKPYAADHGIELVELERVMVRSGESRTLWQELTREGSKSLKIPVRMSNGAPGTRSCTADYKIKVIGRELKKRGATAENPAVIGIGISVDEIHRANNRITEPHERITYPLLDLGLRRTDCFRVIRGGGCRCRPRARASSARSTGRRPGTTCAASSPSSSRRRASSKTSSTSGVTSSARTTCS